MYRLLSQCFDSPDKPASTNTTDKGVFLAEKWPLLGLDRKHWKDYNIQSFQSICNIKPFEVRQKKFDQFIAYLDQLNLDLTRIKFSSDLLEEEHEQLIKLLRQRELPELLEFVYQQRYDFGNDVEEISFKPKNNGMNNIVSISRNAVLTADLEDDAITDLMSSEPIGILAGTFIPYLKNQDRERGEV